MMHDPKGRIITIGVFLLPIVILKVTAVFMGDGGPGTASGSSGQVVARDPAPEPFSPKWSEEQIAAAMRVAALRDEPFGQSPLLHAEIIVDPVQGGPIDKPPERPTPPDLTVQVILKSSTGNIALIRGKRFEQGDDIGETGWVIELIDSDSRSVTILHPPSGEKAVLAVPMP